MANDTKLDALFNAAVQTELTQMRIRETLYGVPPHVRATMLAQLVTKLTEAKYEEEFIQRFLGSCFEVLQRR